MTQSRYLRFLPAFYANSQKDPEGSDFLSEYLNVFEALFSGIEPNPLYNRKGIDELLNTPVLGNLFYPRFSFLFPNSTAFIPPIQPSSSQPTNPNAPTVATPLQRFNQYIGVASNDSEINTKFVPWLNDFLGWLGGWVALSLDQSWSLDQKRTYIASAMPLYRSRGTVSTLNTVLTTWTSTALASLWATGDLEVSFPSTYYLGTSIALQVSDGVAVADTTTMSPYYPALIPFTVGSTLDSSFNSTLNPILTGSRPGYFFVSLVLPNYLNPSGTWSLDKLRNLERLTRRVIEQARPAASSWNLNVYPTFQVGVAILGSTTLLGQIPAYATNTYQLGMTATLGVNTWLGSNPNL